MRPLFFPSQAPLRDSHLRAASGLREHHGHPQHPEKSSIGPARFINLVPTARSDKPQLTARFAELGNNTEGSNCDIEARDCAPNLRIAGSQCRNVTDNK